MLKTRKTRIFVVIMTAVLALALVGPMMAFAALRTNYDWYKGHENATEYTIGTAGELKALASLVNGTGQYDTDNDGKADSIPAVTFQGKKITLSEGLPANFLGEAIEPIGTATHPFQGAFDGSARQIDNFKLEIGASSAASVKNIGFFGCVGKYGSIAGVTIGASSSIKIARGASSIDYIENVGMVAGYCAGTMTGCSNAGTLSVESAVAQQSMDDFIPVRNIGGVAGQCIYDMNDCTNSGAVSVRETSSLVAAYERSQLVARVGGVAGLLGDETRIGTYETHIYGEASKHGSISGCVNTGKVSVDTPTLGGLDRFGVQTSAESMYVGGVVGYSQGSVLNCTNGQEKSPFMGDDGQDVGYVDAENGNIVGGVCGSVRGVLADNSNIAWADDGADGNDPLVVSGCANYGDVYARVTTGGIVGKAGSYTTVTECLNNTKRDYFGNVVPTFVVATRWNKPGPGGIAGTANGTVSFCANFATIASAKWKDEGARTLSTQDGYYAAGIVGMLTYFDDQAVAHGFQATPISEVFSCYNAGEIVAGANMRQRGIVGENNGYVYDNVLLEGVVSNDELVYGDDVSESEASGAVGENRVCKASELRGSAGVQAIAFMNKNSEANSWQRYWIAARATSSEGLNSGYPLLNAQDPWEGAKTSLTGATVVLESDAPYTGGESVPSAAVKLGGAVLTENADYRVVPQAGATNPSSGKKYRATVVGLGRYDGQAAQTLAYDIVPGDFSKCTITVASHTFDYDVQPPSAEDVIVRTPAGTEVPGGEYTFSLVDEAGEAVPAPIDAGSYTLVAEAKSGSELFTGAKRGTYRIKPASFMREVDLSDVKISYLGQEYPWVDSKQKGETDNPATTLRYTGAAVKPTVGEVMYKGHVLVEGRDYRVVYGNSNSDDGYPDDMDANNMGKQDGRSIGCVTIRYISGQKTNFTSYANMFYNIVDNGQKVDLSLARGVVDGEQISDGREVKPIQIWLNNTKLAEGVDYSIEYTNNIEPGTARYRATGMGNFSGFLEGQFDISASNAYELSYDFKGAGTAKEPYEATVTGVEYKSSRDVFDMVVPASVEHDGHAYAVTAIGEAAFGGSRASDFSGSARNESKMKIASVALPATVRSIGNFAFGTNVLSLSSKPALASVDIASESQLETIGEYAFSQCVNLVSFTFPEQVSTVGDYAFEKCSALSELRFLTSAADAPASVSTRAFSSCANVIVRGYDVATNVRKVVTDNRSKNFRFVAFDSIEGVAVSPIGDQLYTGRAIEPKVSVSLSGQRLTEGADYTVSYENNVDAGTARVVVTGAGSYGGSVEKEFSILPADIGLTSFTRVADQAYTGSAVALAADLTYKGRLLEEGVDYELSYANASGTAIGAPFAAGQYRLVVTGKGNFTRQIYRAFSIVAPEITDDAIGAIGQQMYAGVACEPDPTVTVAGKVLERDRDYTLSFANNVDVGQGSVTVYGIGSYAGQAQASFPIVAASLANAAVAGVGDVQANGSPVAFDPVVIAGGRKLASGVDYAISYADASGKALAAQSTMPTGGEEANDGEAVADGEAAFGSEASDATADAIALAVQDEVASDAGGSAGKALDSSVADSFEGVGGNVDSDAEVPGDTSATSAQEASLLKQGGLLDAQSVVAQAVVANAPSAVGSYQLVVTGMGNYAGSSTSVDFKITGSAPAAKKDLSGASVTLAETSFAYDGTARKPQVSATLSGTALKEGVDYALAYENNVDAAAANAANAPVAVIYGMGSYEGTARATFAIAAASIAETNVGNVGAQEYAGGAIRPHVVVKVGTRSLVEGVDYMLEYGANTKPGANAGTVTVKGISPNYFGQVVCSFDIDKADVSSALVSLEYEQVAYAERALTPAVTVVHRGRTLKQGSEYTVSYAGNIDAGTAMVTVAGIGDYCTGRTSVAFTIVPKEVQRPVANTGLAYTGSAQAGVAVGKGIAVTAGSAKATNAGTYEVTLAPAAGYTWPGGFKAPVTLSYTIAPASLANAKVVLAKSSLPYTGKAQKPSVKSVKVGNAVANAADFALQATVAKKCGAYKATLVAKGANFTGKKTVAYKIVPAAQKLVVKAKSPSVKASALKKAAQTVKLSRIAKVTGAKTKLAYAKAKGSSAKLKVNKKTGAVTVAKGTKAGSYKLVLKVSAGKSANYKAASKTTKVTVKVK